LEDDGVGLVDYLSDSFGRVARKLRISVTDRCNFRCQFCMPKTPVWLPRREILTYEEIHRVASLFAQVGVQKIRLSGGEPLMRKDIENLVQMLATIPGIKSLSMTTNGFLLAEKAAALKEAGLKGVTVSLHSLKPERFSEITGGGVLRKVLTGIRAAKENGFTPLKVNAVVIKGCNEDEIADLASLARAGDVTVRFIEYMPFDGQQLWGLEKVVSAKEIVDRIRERYELVAIPRETGSTAKIYRFADGPGEVGVISSITEPFCSDCDRIRLSADGKIVPCLFDKSGFDLRPLLRNGASDEAILHFMRDSVLRKAPGVETLLKQFSTLAHVRPMHTIGG
jgi:cyclic pyranopterin phosphate synthase